jgi:hypothetical protein
LKEFVQQNITKRGAESIQKDKTLSFQTKQRKHCLYNRNIGTNLVGSRDKFECSLLLAASLL